MLIAIRNVIFGIFDLFALLNVTWNEFIAIYDEYSFDGATKWRVNVLLWSKFIWRLKFKNSCVRTIEVIQNSIKSCCIISCPQISKFEIVVSIRLSQWTWYFFFRKEVTNISKLILQMQGCFINHITNLIFEIPRYTCRDKAVVSKDNSNSSWTMVKTARQNSNKLDILPLIFNHKISSRTAFLPFKLFTKFRYSRVQEI